MNEPIPATNDIEIPDDLPADSSMSYFGPESDTKDFINRPKSETDDTVDVFRSKEQREKVPEAAWVASTYSLNEKLATGGMGEVWHATQSSLNRIVAVKRVREDIREPEERARVEWEFRQEAYVSARLEHPNIVPVHDLGRDEAGRPLLAMKLVKGRRWQQILSRDFETLPAHQYIAKHLAILMSMTQAVAFAHSRGIVHRDLKPSQAMVGEFGETLLMDWGLALVHDPEALELNSGPIDFSHMPTVETATNPSGTIGFMAPEQTRRTAAGIGPWTDVYLLGGTLYYLLTGYLPHPGETTRECFVQAAMGHVIPPREAAKDREIPEELAEIAMKAMDFDPANRISSATAFHDRVSDYMTGATRRRESEACAIATEARLAPAPSDYRTYASIVQEVAKARDLWPENPRVPKLENEVHGGYARLALIKGDLALARLQAEGVAEASSRESLLGMVTAAEAEVAAQARQRRLLVRSVAGLLSVLCVVLAVSYSGTRMHNKALVKARDFAERARREAVTQQQVALTRAGESTSLVHFMLDELRDELDMTIPRDLRLRDAVAKQVISHYDAIDISNDSREAQIAYANALSQVANSLGDLALLDEAERFASESLRLRRELHEPTDTRIADSLYDLGEIAMNRAQYEESARLLRESITMFRASPAGNDVSLGTALNDLGTVLFQLGQVDEAEKVLRENLALERSGAKIDPDSLAMGVNNLALLLFNTGRPKEGAEQLREALALLKSNPKTDDRRMAIVLNNLGQYLVEDGALDEGEAFLREALAFDEASWGPDHPTVAVDLNNLALALDARGNQAEAEQLVRRALAIDEAAYGPNHPLIANRLNNLGSFVEFQNRPQEAEPHYRRAVAILESSPSIDRREAAVSLYNLALVLQKLDRMDEARDYARRAAEANETAAAYDPDAVALAKKIREKFNVPK